MQKGLTFLSGARAQLYSTIVVQYKPLARQVILSTGGWNTRSTAKAMNRAFEKYGLDFHASIKKGVFTVKTPFGDVFPHSNRTVVGL